MRLARDAFPVARYATANDLQPAGTSSQHSDGAMVAMQLNHPGAGAVGDDTQAHTVR